MKTGALKVYYCSSGHGPKEFDVKLATSINNQADIDSARTKFTELGFKVKDVVQINDDMESPVVATIIGDLMEFVSKVDGHEDFELIERND